MSYVRSNGLSGAAGGDYMALPSMRRAQAQSAAVVTWLERAQQSGRPLEDWLESKINRVSSDLDDIHTFVVYGQPR